MSLSPTVGISRLSLENISPTTPPQRMDLSRDDAPGEGDDSTEENNGSTVQSPTRLRYNIERLPERTQDMVRSLWGDTFEEPPELSLQWCDRVVDSDGNIDCYAFQLHEVVPRSVRIGSPKSKFSEPNCQCGRSKPCKHLIWLSDYIAQQALCAHDPREPLNMNEHGYPDELGEPFQCISDMRLDVLADGLRCEIGNPLHREGASPQRLAEAKSIIASIAEADDHIFDSYRADLTQAPFDPRSLVHHQDAEATLFSLLVASHRLSAWLRSQLRPSDPVRSPFRQIESRAARILADFDAFVTSPSQEDHDAGEGPCDLAWAASSLTRCTLQIHALITHAEAPLPPTERGNAARALVRILRGVVDRHYHPHHLGETSSLYTRLIGDGPDEGFLVADSLELLVDQAQFIDEIEDIMAEVGTRGAAASWVAKMEAVVARMRGNRRRSSARGLRETPSRTAAAAGKGKEREGRRQRAESPALGPVEHGQPGSASASGVGIGASSAVGLGIAGYGPGVGPAGAAGPADAGGQFLVPETPTAGPSSSSRARGSGRVGRGGSSGGAGSKRQGSSGSARGSKRAR